MNTHQHGTAAAWLTHADQAEARSIARYRLGLVSDVLDASRRAESAQRLESALLFVSGPHRGA